MRFETFKSLLQNCYDMYNTKNNNDAKLSEVFGTEINSTGNLCNTYIDNTLNIIKEDLNCTDNKISELFWDGMIENNGQDIELNGINYENNIKNIWLYLNDLLNDFEDKYSYPAPGVTINEIDVSQDFVDNNKPKFISDISVDEEMSTLSSGSSFDKSEKEVELETDDIPLITLKKLSLYKSQLRLENKKLSDILENKVKYALNSDYSIDNFNNILEVEFDTLKLDAKYSDTLNKIESHFRMVLGTFIGEPMSQNTLEMISFEVKNVLNKLKNIKSLFDYTVEIIIEDEKVSGSWYWEDSNEKPKIFSIEIDEEIKIEFK